MVAPPVTTSSLEISSHYCLQRQLLAASAFAGIAGAPVLGADGGAMRELALRTAHAGAVAVGAVATSVAAFALHGFSPIS